jgi:PhoH-like ATPase
MTSDRKTFILDTSVLLYDKNSIHSFPENDVIIPLVVLDELDSFKEKSGMLGEYARYVNRFLDDLRSEGSLNDGVRLKNGQNIRVEINHCKNVPEGLDPVLPDNRIIAVAHELSKTSRQKVIVITKDINFRVKCDALKIHAEDYYKDRILLDDDNKIYSGQNMIHARESVIDKFHNNGKIHVNELNSDEKLYQNQLIIVKSFNGSSSLLGTVKGKHIIPLSSDICDTIDVKPRNKEQKFALSLLTNKDIPLVSITGIAGSGKTFLALMCGLSGLNQKLYERIVITRSMQAVGKEIGFLPGNIREKMDPWLAPVMDNFRHAFKDVTYFELMIDKGKIEIAPMSFIRGRTFSNSYIIVDESQNSTIHELKTVITRVGENSKIVLLGDIEQIDTPYIDNLSNGLSIVSERFKNEKLAGHITLIKGERSSLATLASKVI